MGSTAKLNPPTDLTLAQKMLSALSGSILTSLLVTPLDVVRIRLQSQQAFPTIPSASALPVKSLHGFPAFAEIPANLGISACCRQVFFVNSSPENCLIGSNMMLVQNPAPPQSFNPLMSSSSSSHIVCVAEESRQRHRHFTSTLDGLTKIAQHEGPRTLWRGLTATLIMAVPSNVIYYSGYDWLRTNPSSPFSQYPYIPDAYTPLLAGSSARVLAAVTISPIEMFRTRLQATPTSSQSTLSPVMQTLNGMRTMVETGSIFSLWRGLTLTLWRDAPFSAIYWFGYESFRAQLLLRRRVRSGETDIPSSAESSISHNLALRQNLNTTDTLIDSFTAGALAGSIASVITQPFDVGKTRKQVSNIRPPPISGSTARHLLPEELPMPRFVWHIFQNHGLAGLFQGGVARVLKVAPSCAIMISTYEIGKKMAASWAEPEL